MMANLASEGKISLLGSLAVLRSHNSFNVTGNIIEARLWTLFLVQKSEKITFSTTLTPRHAAVSPQKTCNNKHFAMIHYGLYFNQLLQRIIPYLEECSQVLAILD